MRITGPGVWGPPPDRDEALAVLRRAVELGVNLIDTADSYGPEVSEELIAEALHPYPGGLVIATKGGLERTGLGKWPRNGHPGHLREACEGSLRRLRVERIDLYQLHEPDPTTPIAETLAALDELVREGIVGAIGCSNFSAAELQEADRVARERGLARFATLQNEYSLLERGIEAEVAPACERLGVSILPYFPLYKGLLTGKYRRGEAAPEGTRLAGGTPGTDTQFDVVEALRAYAEERGAEMIDVAIGGLAAQPAVGSVIAGATKPEQVRANVGGVRWQPSEEDLAELDRIAPTPRS
jgi:aryl-alcohol dehydrogenase-like predicted oxidoreductase